VPRKGYDSSCYTSDTRRVTPVTNKRGDKPSMSKEPDCCLSFYLRILIILLVSSNSSWEFEFRSWRDILDTTLCEKVCQWLDIGWWFRTRLWLRQTEHIHGHLWHRYSPTINQVMVATVKLSTWWFQRNH
jgi:hypothetical protein